LIEKWGACLVGKKTGYDMNIGHPSIIVVTPNTAYQDTPG